MYICLKYMLTCMKNKCFKDTWFGHVLTADFCAIISLD